MTERDQYDAIMRWNAGNAIKPYITVSGHIAQVTPTMVGLLTASPEGLISRSRLSFASDLICEGASEGQMVDLLVRG